MKKNKALLPLIRLFQFNQWFVVFILIAVTLTMFAVAVTLLKIPELVPNMPMWMTAIPLILPPFVFVIAALTMLPAFMIYKSFAQLLKKYREQEFVDLLAQKEVKALRKYLWIQFVLNMMVGLYSIFSKNSIDEKPSLGAGLESYQSIFEKFEQASAFTKWLTISLDHTMPLIYLLVLFIAIELNQETVRMRSELNDVV